MGDWGPGAFQNDHALDLLSIETSRWVSALRERLDAKEEPGSWQGVEGLLIYVRLLAYAGQQGGTFGMLVDATSKTPESSHAVATRWRERYLALDGANPRKPDAATARREETLRTFDELLAVAPKDDAPPPKRARKPRRPANR